MNIRVAYLKCLRVNRFVGPCFLLLLSITTGADAEDWPCWRGPRGDGTSVETNVPKRWNGETGLNIVWKTPVAGRGHASPVVWGNRIFLVACIEETQDRVLACY